MCRGFSCRPGGLETRSSCSSCYGLVKQTLDLPRRPGGDSPADGFPLDYGLSVPGQIQRTLRTDQRVEVKDPATCAREVHSK